MHFLLVLYSEIVKSSADIKCEITYLLILAAT